MYIVKSQGAERWNPGILFLRLDSCAFVSKWSIAISISPEKNRNLKLTCRNGGGIWFRYPEAQRLLSSGPFLGMGFIS